MDKRINLILAMLGSLILFFLPYFSNIGIAIFSSFIYNLLVFITDILSFIGFILLVYFSFILIKSYFKD